MRIVLHARHGQAPFEALALGCRELGHTVVWLRPGVWQPDAVDQKADAVVVHGLHGNAGRIRDAYRARRVPVWIMDLPRLRDEPDAVGLFLDSLHWLPTAQLRAVVAPEPIENRSPDVVLVAGQKPGDHAHGMDSAAIREWARQTVAYCRAVSPFPVLYRPHPKDENEAPADLYGADEWSSPATPLRADLARAAAVVVHNSTVGWDAMAAGVPVLALSPDAAFADYCTTFADMADLEPQRRAEALARAASSQWTMEELASGAAAASCFANVARGGEHTTDPLADSSGDSGSRSGATTDATQTLRRTRRARRR
jgi:hypothetical protein